MKKASFVPVLSFLFSRPPAFAEPWRMQPLTGGVAANSLTCDDREAGANLLDLSSLTLPHLPVNHSKRRWLRFASVAAIAALALGIAAAQAGLPKNAVSIPLAPGTQELSAAIQASHSCVAPGLPVVLPPVVLRFGAHSSLGNVFDEQSLALHNLPPETEVWLHIVADPESADPGTEQQFTAQVSEFLNSAPLASPLVRGVIVEPAAAQKVSDLFLFGLLRLAVSVKSANPALRLAFVFQPGFISQNSDAVKRLATYSDLLGTFYSPDWRADAKWIADHALNRPLILKINSGNSATDSYLNSVLSAAGISVEMLWSNRPDPKSTNQLCAETRFMTASVPPSLLHLEGSALPFSITVDGTKSEEARWFGSGETSEIAVLAPVHGLAGNPRTVTLLSRSKAPYELQCFDPATGSQLTLSDPIKSDTGWTAACALTSEFALIKLHRKSDAGNTAFSQVEVKSGIDLSIEEIIARWQQYKEAQKRSLDNYQASSFMTLHFETTAVAQAFDISMKLRQFFGRNGRMELEQTEFYVNGVKFSNRHEFPLPQLEPEKVLTQPLELALNERYTYKLLGTEQIDGALCFIVGVEPKEQDEALYSGKIWIDGTSFREVRQTLSQRGSKGSIVVNVETQNFTLVDDGKGHAFNLLRSISAQQTLNAAGRDFQLQRTLKFSDFAINSPHFQDDLAAAYHSDDPMYRDTDQGLRELQKKGGERVLVQNSSKRIVSLVGGAFYQGTYNFPIPIAGLSVADFDFRHTGAQLSVFFAGPILATNLSKQYSPKLRLGADLALNALPGEYRVYCAAEPANTFCQSKTADTENTGDAMWSWEQTLGVRATWQAATHFSLTGFTYLAYDIYRPTSDTSSSYLEPRNGVALLPGVQVKMTEKGYIFTADGTRGQRLAWKQFGCLASADQCNELSLSPSALPESGYTLYDADLNKDYYFRKFTKGGWDFSYYGGDQLDRFSRYFPSFFSNPRIHGIPGGTDSFDAIAQGNVHYGFNVMDLMKFEGLYSYARARNLYESSHFRKFDGVETNFNTAGPKGTLLQGTVSYALDGNIARYNSRWGVMIMIFKPFK